MAWLPAPRWQICGFLLLATTLNYMDRTALNQTSVQIMIAFNLNNEQYGNLESAFTAAFALGTLSIGWLVDRVNVRSVYPLLVIGWSIAGFLSGFANGLMSLMICRVALGFFEAGNWPCGIRMTRQVLPPAERPLGNSLFQSGTAFGAILTPIVVLACLRWIDVPAPDAWRTPFQVIGVLGIGWAIAWWIWVPRRPTQADTINENTFTNTTAPRPTTFVNLLGDRRFWILFSLILAVNIPWHTFRVWLPHLFTKDFQHTNEEMQFLSIGYYVIADVGSWCVGLGTIALVRRGYRIEMVRLGMFGFGTACIGFAALLPFVDSRPLLYAIVGIVAFGGLGLFATYFSLSQELSAVHQGKVTGTLGCMNAMVLTVLISAEGRFLDLTGRRDLMLAASVIPTVFALGLLMAFWPNGTSEPAAPEKSRG